MKKHCEIVFYLRYKWIIGGALIALISGFILLYRISTPLTPESIKNITCHIDSGRAVEYFATYDLFNKHFVLLFTVFGVLISVFGIVIPLVFYFYQQNMFNGKIKILEQKFNASRTAQEEILMQNINDFNNKIKIDSQIDILNRYSIRKELYFSLANFYISLEKNDSSSQESYISKISLYLTKTIFYAVSLKDNKTIRDALNTLSERKGDLEQFKKGTVFDYPSCDMMRTYLKNDPDIYSQYEEVYKILTPWEFKDDPAE